MHTTEEEKIILKQQKVLMYAGCARCGCHLVTSQGKAKPFVRFHYESHPVGTPYCLGCFESNVVSYEWQDYS